MKTLTKALLVFTIILNFASAKDYSYRLTISNPEFNADNALEFSIYLLNTGKSDLNYFAGQYFIDFNPEIANGGELKYTLIGSALPPGFVPRNPQISGNQLRLACNSISSDKSILPLISSDKEGTLIAKLKLETSAKKLSVEKINFKWSENERSFRTKIFTYDDSRGIDITNTDFFESGINSLAGLNFRGNSVADKFELSQNYPNPFNPETKIRFVIPNSGNGLTNVKLSVYDITGKEVSNLVNRTLEPGSYEVTFNGSNVTSGVYFYKLSAGSFSQTHKMLLIK